MKLFKTKEGNIVLAKNLAYVLPKTDWDNLLNNDDLFNDLKKFLVNENRIKLSEERLNKILLPPVKSQEIWASGVTYFRSKTARMEESKDTGGSSFYDKVYDAQRPELFFKSTPDRVKGPFEKVRIRKDSQWSVPEPELTLVISSTKKIIG